MLNKILSKRKTFLITKKENKDKTKIFKKKGFKILLINSLKSKKDFKIFFKNLFKLGYRRVFFETGLTFLNTLITYKFLNDLYVFQNTKKIKKNGFNNCSNQYLKKIKLRNEIRVNLDSDKLYKVNF